MLPVDAAELAFDALWLLVVEVVLPPVVLAAAVELPPLLQAATQALARPTTVTNGTRVFMGCLSRKNEPSPDASDQQSPHDTRRVTNSQRNRCTRQLQPACVHWP
jgi:hypothetical protein